MAPIDIGVIGLGRQGKEHLTAVETLAQVGAGSVTHFVAVCDNDPTRMTTLPARINRYTDFTEMLKRNRLEAVIVAVPNHQHVSICGQALAQSIHVLKEKPLALTMEDADRLARAANASGSVLYVSQQRRFHPYYTIARSWLPRLGQIHLISYGFSPQR